jgi:hypothetical protein
MEKKKKKKSFGRGVYEDAPGKKQWPWHCEPIAFVSLCFPAAIAHTLALPLLLRKSPASFAISSLTVVHKTASLLSFTQTVVFSLYLQIVRNSNFKTAEVSKFRSFTQPTPSLSSFLNVLVFIVSCENPNECNILC